MSHEQQQQKQRHMTAIMWENVFHPSSRLVFNLLALLPKILASRMHINSASISGVISRQSKTTRKKGRPQAKLFRCQVTI
jgi:hypothetical protein